MANAALLECPETLAGTATWARKATLAPPANLDSSVPLATEELPAKTAKTARRAPEASKETSAPQASLVAWDPGVFLELTDTLAKRAPVAPRETMVPVGRLDLKVRPALAVFLVRKAWSAAQVPLAL